MRDRLESREFEPAEIEEAVVRLIELGELDDATYAELFATDKRDLSGWGSERIASALTSRGIAPELIERVCSSDHGSELDGARRLLAGRGESLDDDRSRNRALGFLTRRGYTYEVAYEAIRGSATFADN